LINTNNFYENLKAQFELSYQEKFAKEEYSKLFYFAKNFQDAIKYIENYKTENRGTKWD
jgi:predicted Rossmann-fold nucleotide-binding protein